MSDRTAELMRLCLEKVDLKGQDAAFFQNVMNALLEARYESDDAKRHRCGSINGVSSKHSTLYGHPIGLLNFSNW